MDILELALRVETVYYENSTLGQFKMDLVEALQAAADDEPARSRLWRLFLDYFDAKLPARGASRLISYLEGLQVWREDGGWLIYKTSDEPCIVFTATVSRTAVHLIALGACYRYPAQGEEWWWLNVICPRIRSFSNVEG